MKITNTKTITITDTATLTTSEMMRHLKETFEVYSYWDYKELDKEFPKPENPTTRTFPLEAESSAMKGSSWNEMEPIRESMMTLREYILYFEAYHKETGKHPDAEGWTIFKDRLSDGYVARGYWYPARRGVRFGWSRPVDRDSCDGARCAVAISLPPCDSLAPSATDETLEASVASLESDMEKIKKTLIL